MLNGWNFNTGVNQDNGNNNVLLRGPWYGPGGAYSCGTATGSIVATGAVNAVIWTFHYTGTGICIIEDVSVAAIVVSTITTSVPYNLQLFFARGLTTDPTSNNAVATLTGNNAKRRTGLMATCSAVITTLTTAAAGLTGQTLGNDTQPIATLCGATGTVVATQFFGGQALMFADEGGLHPLVLKKDEGLALQAPLAGPATGTFAININVNWTETTGY